jgi:Mg2+-importing ATPase
MAKSRVLLSNVLPRKWLPARKGQGAGIRVSPVLIRAATSSGAEVLESLGSSPKGLSEEEAERRLREHGPNVVGQEAQHGWIGLLGKAIVNPLVILLLVLATVSFLTDQEGEGYRAGIVMLVMVVIGVVLRFVQEARADATAAKLKSMIHVTATVLRDGQAREVPLAGLVPGDVVRLAAGDMIPGDVRILSCKDLFVIQASLTGESFPVEKFDPAEPQPRPSPLEHCNVCYLGTSVESGSATAVVAATGRETYLGSMAGALTGAQPVTEFDRGVNRFTWLMIYFIIVMAPTVFLINYLAKGELRDSFLFAMAVAVGLTPEMLPMIVTVCLSKGALMMSRKKVVVKRLNSIQNFGAIDVLCTDKTGTLTMDRVTLEKYCDVVREEDESVLALAYLNSHFQTGLKNVLDRAILDHTEVHESTQQFRKVDEIPFDFSRKMMSVVVQAPDGPPRLLCKGAPESVFARCTHYELSGEIRPIEPILIADLREEYDDLSGEGFRVLALAYRDLEPKSAYSKDDEKDLILKGYVAFLDPPKESAAAAITALQRHGVAVKVLTGDNERVSAKICRAVELSADQMLLGPKVEGMSDAELAVAAEQTTLFARLSPAHKQRIIRALQSKGHVVGFLGDGINDAPALRAADVGISVDSAVDIAKESADLILLEKSLMVLEEGVLEGRSVFANILKYIRMSASSNFGNNFSVLGASFILPFVPMQAIQLLTNNLLYDFSQVPIPTDKVDPEQVARPRPWSIREITRFILCIGPISSIFDYTTFFIMLYVFGVSWVTPDNMKTEGGKHLIALFQTGWFVESLVTQTLIIHIIRTNKLPFIQSQASWPLILTGIAIIAFGIWLPYSPVASSMGFTPLPWQYWPLLAFTTLCYVVLTQLVKMWLVRKKWI